MTQISDVIERAAKQTAVYWAAPTWDGYGGKLYPLPIEISVRWEDVSETILGADGEQTLVRSKVFPLQDLDVDGYLYLGNLVDLTSEQQKYPETITTAWRVKRFDKIPSLTAPTDVARVVYL